MGTVMKYNKFLLAKKYALVFGLLASLEEEVVSEEDYINTKNFDINNDYGFEQCFSVIIKPWLEGYKGDEIKEILLQLDELINSPNHLVEEIFSYFFFVYEIDKEKLFLKRLKSSLESFLILNRCE